MLLQAVDARAGPAYLAELLQRAEATHLAERREWQVLLHYRLDAAGEHLVSDADDSRFFLASTGKTDPQAELAATLRAFFSTEYVGGDPQPAQCAFIARYRWLRRELDFDDRRLPPQPCDRFQHWFRELNAEAATLVFTSAYLNNPASLFGHTLLRLDRRGQTEQTRLLAYAINYAADDSSSHGLLYAVDGVTGGFKGRFDIQPYYKLVRTYSDLESRDIWEYSLKLNPPQLQRLLEHAWELRGIRFDYFFFRENCAWQLLTLLEAAEPTLQLSDEFLLWTLPPDTIRLLAQQSGLVEAVTDRPARGTTIHRRYEVLTHDERWLIQRLRDDPAVAALPPFTRLPPERQALLLELALDDRQHHRASKSGDSAATAPSDEIAHRLLTARNRLKTAATPVPIEPYATRPETGHASRRLGIGFGQRAGTTFVEWNARASYHGLLEPDAGYTPDAQIELLSIVARAYEESGGLKLDRLTVLDITSLPPTNALSLRPAWQIHAGWEPYPATNCPDCMVFNLSSGLGLATETHWPWRTVWFGLPGLEFDYGSVLAGNQRAGLSMTIGALSQPAANWKVLASVTGLDDRSGDAGATVRATLSQSLTLTRDLLLRTDWRYLEGTHEFEMGLQAYF